MRSNYGSFAVSDDWNGFFYKTSHHLGKLVSSSKRLLRVVKLGPIRPN